MTPFLWHTLAWFGLLILALLNGTLRVLTYGKWVGDATARSFAVFPFLLGLACVTVWLHHQHPLPSSRQAWLVGLIWVVATVAFEFALGRLGPSQISWPQLWAAYDVRTGSLWVAIPLVLLLFPPLFHWLRQLP